MARQPARHKAATSSFMVIHLSFLKTAPTARGAGKRWLSRGLRRGLGRRRLDEAFRRHAEERVQFADHVQGQRALGVGLREIMRKSRNGQEDEV